MVADRLSAHRNALSEHHLCLGKGDAIAIDGGDGLAIAQGEVIFKRAKGARRDGRC